LFFLHTKTDDAILLTTKEHLDAFVQGFHLDLSDTIEKFSNLLSTQECGTAEIVIPPNSKYLPILFFQVGILPVLGTQK
jgi:hypothetical protein